MLVNKQFLIILKLLDIAKNLFPLIGIEAIKQNSHLDYKFCTCTYVYRCI